MKTVALVTGVSGGIGYATAKQLLERGIAVLGMSRTPVSFDEDQKEFTYVQGDVSVREDREKFVHTAMNKYGHIDILVNVAGVAPKIRADLLEMTEESYDFVMNINTKGMLFLTQLVANQMKKNPGKQKGSICQYVNLLSARQSIHSLAALPREPSE